MEFRNLSNRTPEYLWPCSSTNSSSEATSTRSEELAGGMTPSWVRDAAMHHAVPYDQFAVRMATMWKAASCAQAR